MSLASIMLFCMEVLNSPGLGLFENLDTCLLFLSPKIIIIILKMNKKKRKKKNQIEALSVGTADLLSQAIIC